MVLWSTSTFSDGINTNPDSVYSNRASKVQFQLVMLVPASDMPDVIDFLCKESQ